MKDKDKLWLVIYINVSAIDASEIEDYIGSITKAFDFDDSVQKIVIPERRARKKSVEVLQTPCVLFPNSNNSTKATHSLND